jgi:hypothetical protein
MLVLSLFLVCNITLGSEDEGYFFEIGPKSFIKHNYLSLNLQVVKIVETKEIAKNNMNSRNLYSISGGKSSKFNRYNSVKYNGFNRFLNNLGEGDSSFASYSQDQPMDQVVEDGDLLDRKYVPRILSSYQIQRRIPKFCNNEVRVFLKFIPYYGSQDDNWIKMRQGVILNFRNNEVILGHIKKSDESKKRLLETINELSGKVGEYYDREQIKKIEEKKKTEDQYVKKLDDMRNSQEYEQMLSVRYRVLEGENSSEESDLDESPQFGKDIGRRPSSAATDVNSQLDLLRDMTDVDIDPEDLIKKDSKNNKNSENFNPESWFGKKENNLEKFFTEVEKKLRQRQLKMYRFSETGLRDGSEMPMITLEGILDSEKRYFPINIMDPTLNGCVLDFKIKFKFDRYYDLDETTTEFNLFNDGSRPFNEELMNKYRENELIKMKNSTQEAKKQLRKDIGENLVYSN